MLALGSLQAPYFPETLPEAELTGIKKSRDTFNFNRLGRLNVRVQYHIESAANSFSRAREKSDDHMLEAISHLLAAQNNLGIECGLDEEKRASLFREKIGGEITLSKNPELDMGRGLREAIAKAIDQEIPESPSYMTLKLMRRFPREELKQVSLILSVLQRFQIGTEPFDVRKKDDGGYSLGSVRTGVYNALRNLAENS